MACGSGLRFGLCASGILNGNTRFPGCLPVSEILLNLFQVIARRFQRQIVLLRRDGREQRIFPHIQLGKGDVCLRFFQRIAVLFLLGIPLRLGLYQMLFGFGDIRQSFFQLEFLLRSVELHRNVPGLDRLARLQQTRDVQFSAAHHGSGQYLRIAATQFAARGYRQAHVAAPTAGASQTICKSGVSRGAVS